MPINRPSTTYEQRLEPPGQGRRDQILNMVRERYESSDKFYSIWRRNFSRFYNQWRGIEKRARGSTKNDLTLPLIYATIWGDVARKVATAYSQWPVVSFAGFGPDDSASARKQEVLVNAQLRDADIVRKEITTFLSGDLYGTAISQVMWDHKEEVRSRTSFQALPLSQERVRQIRRERIVTFDGPNYTNIDLPDFYPQPGYKEINGHDGMRWCIVRYYLDLDDVRFMASEAGGRVFNTREVERLAQESALPSSIHRDDYKTRRGGHRDYSPKHLQTDSLSRPIEMLEMWGEIPSELAEPFGGATNVVITMANEKYIFRAVENPFDHRQKPFIKYSPTPDPHYFYAPGKAEIAHQMGIAANRFVNQQLDAADLLIHPMFIYNRNMLVNPRNLRAGPGRIFGVDGEPSKALSPVPLDMRTLQVGSAMTDSLWRYIQMGSGVLEDTVIGLSAGGSDRQTAREFLGRREASGTRLILESVIYDQTYLEPLANMFGSLDVQFLEPPREVLILGESAQVDPVTNEPIQDTRQTIFGEDLEQQYVARANGSTLAISKESQKANDLTMFQVLAGAQPLLAGTFNLTNFLRQMLLNLGYKNVNELLNKNPPQQLSQMLGEQGMNSPGQVPSNDQGLLQLIGGGSPSGPASGIPGPQVG